MIRVTQGVNSPSVFFRWSKDGADSATSPAPTYIVLAPNGTQIASGTLTAQGTRYPFTLTGTLTTANGVGVYEIVATTTDPDADYLSMSETFEVAAADTRLDTALTAAQAAQTAAAAAQARLNALTQSDGAGGFKFRAESLVNVPTVSEGLLDTVIPGDRALNTFGGVLYHLLSGQIAVVKIPADPVTKNLLLRRNQDYTGTRAAMWTVEGDITGKTIKFKAELRGIPTPLEIDITSYAQPPNTVILPLTRAQFAEWARGFAGTFSIVAGVEEAELVSGEIRMEG